jgi:hypothetical protein
MAVPLDWSAVEAKAKKMTSAQLHYARLDCQKAAEALHGAQVSGKDEGYYRDEASIYAREQYRRAEAASGRKVK